jgi:transcriptional regulator with XRE-family HTH domain
MASGSKLPPSALMEEIGFVIDTKIRQKNKWTNESLGKAVGISSSQISLYRNGLKNADIEELDRIYIALEMDTADEIQKAITKSERRLYQR